MKLAKILVLMLVCTLLVATLAACQVEGYTSTTTTDADGNETTETTTYSNTDGVNTTTETTEGEDNTDAEEETEGESASTGTDGAEAANQFAETLQSVFDGNGMPITVPTPEDQGDGMFVINADEGLEFTIQTGATLVYTVTVAGDDQDLMANAFVVFMGVFANGDDLAQLKEAILTNGEPTASIPGCTFKATSLDADGKTLSILTATIG